jgi:hypothetical protein
LQEVMCYGRDEILLYKNIRMAGEECFVCHSKEHMHLDCPECHYLPRKRISK